MASHHPPPLPVSRLCRSCGLEFSVGGPGNPGRLPVYCSDECRRIGKRQWHREHRARNPEKLRARDSQRGTCSDCGKPVYVATTSAPPDRRRCQDCRRARPTVAILPARVCELCGESYKLKPGYRPDQLFCSKSCAQAWRNGARPPYTRVQDDQGTARASRKRRRLQVRAQTRDGVTDAQILERDRWRCGICRQRIGKSYKYPHPRSKSIDHIVPLSEGGDDTAANKRAAHLGCNCGRMNRGGGEQLAMIG